MGEYVVKEEKKKGFDYGTIGIIVGVLVVVISIVWATLGTFSNDDDKSGDGVTWVG